MNKSNVLGIFVAIFLLITMSGPAHSESFGRERLKEFEATTAQTCVQEGRTPAFCACQSEFLNSPTFKMFAESIKSEEDLPKLDQYFVDSAVTECFLDHSVSQQMCIKKMTEATTEYSAQVINDYCDCMAEEINENADRNALKGLDRYQVQMEFTALTEKAHPVCDRVRN